MLRLIRLVLAVALSAWCSICAQNPLEAQIREHERWFDRSKEREDLLRGSFDVLRFQGPRTTPEALARDPKDKKRILDPHFYCTRCAAEGRIAKDRAWSGTLLMDREGASVREWLAEEVKGGAEGGTLIEDHEFVLWSDLPPLQLKRWPQRFLESELRELQLIFPEVSDKTTILTSHQRAHLMLIRAHRLLSDFWWLVGSDPKSFREKYHYLGPHLGMQSKQQIYLFDRERDYLAFATAFIGRTAPSGQVWHLFQSRAMVLLMSAENQIDPQTTNYFLHRLSHNLLDAYRVYAFKVPAWVHMGLAAWIERREATHWNTYCYSEGTIARTLTATRWEPRVRKAVLKNEVRPLTEVMSFEEYGKFEPEEHFIAWSWFCFLLSRGPEKMPVFLNRLKDKKLEESLRTVTEAALKDVYGLSVLGFDAAWREWVIALYPAQ